MKVLKNNWRKPPIEVSVTDAIVSRISSDREGELENLRAVVYELCEVIAPLVEIVATKGLMTKEQLQKLVGYSFTVED